MKGKRGSAYLIVLFLFVIFLTTTVRADVASCNLGGGIWCGNAIAGNCVGEIATAADITYPDNCIVSISQNVTLDKDNKRNLNENNLRTFTFRALTVSDGAKLNFFNTQYSTAPRKAADATCADSTSTCREGTGWFNGAVAFRCYGGTPISNAYTASRGGAGGDGTREHRGGDDYWGGGGGAGAAGGTMGSAGGDGFTAGQLYSGGSGDPGEPNNYCAGSGIIGTGGYDGGRAGGFVKIVADSITITEGSSISVDGEAGRQGNAGRDRTNYGGAGGGPGAGGGGAGKIVLSYITLTLEGTVTANGGNGGKGGAGGKSTENSNDGGSGGGGGGGNGGIIGFAPTQTGSSVEPSKISCSKGLGGAPGEKTQDGGQGIKGEDGSDGLCKTSEMDPGGIGSINANYCSDATDNNKNTVIDMDDLTCRDSGNKWDASIFDEYSDKAAVNYVNSAKNSKDLACGDDIGTCKLSMASGTCSRKANVQPCETQICSFFQGDVYNCGCPLDTQDFCRTENFELMQMFYYEDNMAQSTIVATSTCREVENFCQIYTTNSECNAYSEICEWKTIVPADYCDKLFGEKACKEKSINGCYWEPLPAGSGDLGFTTPDNKYLCLNSMYSDGTFYTPGNEYSWFDAAGFIKKKNKDFDSYNIVQAGNTQFISNKDEWYQCNANAAGISYSANKISEFSTFPPNSREESKYCSVKLEKAISEKMASDSIIQDCSLPTLACRENCNADASCQGWCQEKSYQSGSYMDDCKTACEIKDATSSTGFTQLDEYYSDVQVIFCTQNPNEAGCKFAPSGMNIGEGSDYKNQDYCKLFGTICGGGNIQASSDNCEEVHEALNYVYNEEIDATLGSNKLCTKTQYCENGQFIISSEYVESQGKANEKTCCLGQDAYCKDYDVSKCEDIGGIMKPGICEEGECICSSGIERDGCCLYGKWMTASELDLGINESFICYKESGSSLIQECCGASGCNNEKNLLNEGAYSMSGKVYSLDGVPLHSLITFDKITSEGPVRQVRTYYGKTTGSQISFSDLLYKHQYVPYAVNFSTYDYLDFDILYNDPDVGYELVIQDMNGKTCSFNIKDNIAVKKGPLRWQHITIGLNNIETCNTSFASANISDIQIRIKGPAGVGNINVLVDNFFLRTDETSQHSENRFCSGNWGDWVVNLDGPTTNNEGMKDYTSAQMDNLSVYGPFRDACEGVISYGWTGRLCCGDDTMTGQYGEFWQDDHGVCWNGTTVSSDMTLADALGLSPQVPGWDTALNERHLLFYDDELLSCERSLSSYGTISASYSGTAAHPSDKFDISNEVLDAYSIRGSWMCTADGWIKLDDVVRARIIGATLKSIAAEEGEDYTLMCGDYSGLVNSLGTMNDEQKQFTQYACILRMGDNEFSDNDKVVIGLEASRDIPFNIYQTSVLDKFPTMKLVDDDRNTCMDVSSNVDTGEFFQNCAEDEDGNIELYYNKGLNIVIIADHEIHSEVTANYGLMSFAKTLWSSFQSFFSGLFGSSEQKGLKSFEEDIQSKDFYLSVQGQKSIMGLLQKSSQYMYIRIDYFNLSTASVELIANATRSNFIGADVQYEKVGTRQTIYINTTANIDWKLLTSILRLSPEAISGAAPIVPPATPQSGLAGMPIPNTIGTNAGLADVTGAFSWTMADFSTMMFKYLSTDTGHDPPPELAGSSRVAEFVYKPISPASGEIVTFTSIPSSVGGLAVSHSWFINGVLNNTRKSFSTTFKPGSYDITLKVTNSSGSENWVTKKIIIGQGTDKLNITSPPVEGAPVAEFVYNPIHPTTGAPIRFTSVSKDSDGTIKSYVWYVDGVVAGDSKILETTLATGAHNVTLKVTDNSGKQGIVTKKVIAGEGGEGSVIVILPPLRKNVPPVANFTYEPKQASTNEKIIFTSSSYDSDGQIIFHKWYVDGILRGTLPNYTRAFDYPGRHYIKLKVADNNGVLSSAEVIINITGNGTGINISKNIPPKTSLSFTPLSPVVFERVLVRHNCSDVDGSIRMFSWYVDDVFKGESSTYTAYAANFTVAGTYKVTLKCTDDDGASSTASKEIVVKGLMDVNAAPVARLTYSPLSPVVFERVLVRHNCSDVDGSIRMFSWYVDDVFKGESSTYTAYAANFTVAGTYKVTLKCTDDDGASSTVSQNVIVSNSVKANVSPVASFSYTPTTIIVGNMTKFTSLSTAPSGISSYTWYVNDVMKVSSATASTYSTSFPIQGTYKITLKITDKNGLSSTISKNVAVMEVLIIPPANVAPVAKFTFTPANPVTGNNIVFTSSSTDSDGTIQNYAWYVGSNTVAKSISSTYTTSFSSEGTYSIILKVTDDDGATNSITKSVVVTKPTVPGTLSTFVVDHRHTNIKNIPASCIAKAKRDLGIAYTHSSHGSQITSGMNALAKYDSIYAYNFSGGTNKLHFEDFGQAYTSRSGIGATGTCWDLSDCTDKVYGGIVPSTEKYLNDAKNSDINVVLWSWCGIGGRDMTKYIANMKTLIEEYGDDVTIVFMTGHADGWGEGGNANIANEKIRNFVENDAFCDSHVCVLFDFGDMEDYNPDNAYFLNKRVDDGLYYLNSGAKANWAEQYISKYPSGFSTNLVKNYVSECAHSPEPGETSSAELNCALKAQAVWYMFARLAGWDGNPASTC